MNDYPARPRSMRNKGDLWSRVTPDEQEFQETMEQPRNTPYAVYHPSGMTRKERRQAKRGKK